MLANTDLRATVTLGLYAQVIASKTDHGAALDGMTHLPLLLLLSGAAPPIRAPLRRRECEDPLLRALSGLRC